LNLLNPILCTLGSFAKLRDQELLYDISLACEGQIMPAHQVPYLLPAYPCFFSMSAHHAVRLRAFQRGRELGSVLLFRIFIQMALSLDPDPH
jgi:hypothetical protein